MGGRSWAGSTAREKLEDRRGLRSDEQLECVETDRSLTLTV